MKSKNIYIIRHGQTDYNKMNMVQGRGVDASLNELGRQQATCFFEAYKDYQFDKIYTSALKRTAESVQQFLGLGIPTEALAGLDEISWGTHEGQPYDELRHGKYLEGLAEWTKGNLDHRVGGGETPLEVVKRQKEAMKHILSQNDEELILISTHGRAMRFLICWLMGKPLDQCDIYKHSNLCLYQLSYDGKEMKIVKENDTAHLDSMS